MFKNSIFFLLIFLMPYAAQSEVVNKANLPQRIVSQTLASDEILLAICPPEQISAVSTLAFNPQYSNVITAAKQVGQQVTNNVEHILNLNPDLIIVASYSRAETVQLLQATGAPVLRLTRFQHLEDIKHNIKIIGKAIGAEEKATALVTQMQQEIAEIINQLPKNVPAPRVVFFNQWYYTAGRLTTFDDLLHLIKATNISAEHGIQGHIKINPEQLIAWQPDFIVTEASQDEMSAVRQRLLAHPAIGTSIAHDATRIIVVETRYLSAVSHHIVRALEILANQLYP